MTQTLTTRRIVIAVGGLLALLALTLPFADALAGSDGGTGAGAVRPRPAPLLTGEALDGGRIALHDARGDVVVVNVWASWCAPCRAELPLLGALARKHAEDGLTVVGIDTNDRRDQAQRFLEQIGGTEPMRHVYDPDGEHAVEWGARGVPETFVIDRRGLVVARHSGEVSSTWLEKNAVARLSS
jgi:cytochrome c biogenesis protein CcmG, thiol:disulfide interchange protein DsbE